MKGSDIVRLREEKGWTMRDLGDKLGLSPSAISKWERNPEKEVRKKYVLAIRELMDEPGEEEELRLHRIPIYNVNVTAGDGGFNGDWPEVIDHIPLPEEWILQRIRCKPENLVSCHVRGDSMEPFASSGDLIIVDKTVNYPGDGLYVLRIDGLVVFKRIQWRPDTRELRVISDNTIYEEYRLNDESHVDVQVLGRAVFRIGFV
jgi:phage repressor protein C with HTH and peptisase S24 domain